MRGVQPGSVYSAPLCEHRSIWRHSLLLFVFLQALYLFTSTGRLHVTDEAAVFFQARGLVENGTLEVPASTTGYEFYGKYDTQGRRRAPNGPAHAVALTPFYLLGKAMLRVPGIPSDANDVVTAFAATLSSTSFSALAATLWFILLVRRGTATGIALTATLACALATPLFAYSGWLFSEPLAVCLLVAASLVVFGSSEPVSYRQAAVAGMLLGACLLVRPAHAVTVPLFVAAIFFRDGRRSWVSSVALAMTAAAGLGIYFAWNYHQFGSALDFGYPEFASGKRLNGFETPVLHGILGFLVSPGKSIFIFAPITLVALRGLPELFRRDRGLAVLGAGAPIVYLLLYSGYTQWEGGYCFGPRYMLPAIVMMLFSIGPWLESATSAARRTFLSLVIVGAMVQMVGLATSFLEDQYSNRYYDSHYNYQTSYAPLVSQSTLLYHYVRALNQGERTPPLGKGFDRWFIFMGKAGVGSMPIFLLLSMITAVALSTGLMLGRCLHSPLPEIASSAVLTL